MRACVLCGGVLDDQMKVMRSSTCPHCGKDLRICRNCRFHSPGSHWDCHETIAEPVMEKERSNFCDSFSFAVATGRAAPEKKVDDAQRAFKDLFGA